MPIRPAAYSDLLPASHLLTRAFWDEDLFGCRIHPHRTLYPSEVYLFHLRQLRKDFFDAHTVILLSYSTDLPSSITGVGVWMRKGDGAAALDAAQPVWKWVCGGLVPWVNWLESLVWPNRAADPTQLDVLDRAAPFTKHYWGGERKESWYLALCGTGPEFQGKGYGKELVQWGVRKAKTEGVCASLIAAMGKDGFYRRLGFEGVGWASEGGEGNPLCDVSGGLIMFTEVFGKEKEKEKE